MGRGNPSQKLASRLEAVSDVKCHAPMPSISLHRAIPSGILFRLLHIFPAIVPLVCSLAPVVFRSLRVAPDDCFFLPRLLTFVARLFLALLFLLERCNKSVDGDQRTKLNGGTSYKWVLDSMFIQEQDQERTHMRDESGAGFQKDQRERESERARERERDD